MGDEIIELGDNKYKIPDKIVFGVIGYSIKNVIEIDGMKYKILKGCEREPYVIATLLGIAE